MTTRQKKPIETLSKVQFAELCELVQLGSESKMEQMYADISYFTEDEFEELSWIENDMLIWTEQLLHMLAKKFGFKEPLFPEDVQAEGYATSPKTEAPLNALRLPQTASFVAPVVEPPMPELVIRKVASLATPKPPVGVSEATSSS
jgi:hypothetical protein